MDCRVKPGNEEFVIDRREIHSVLHIVMRGLDPRIHQTSKGLLRSRSIAGSSPAMKSSFD
jgi:hypothetical protein